MHPNASPGAPAEQQSPGRRRIVARQRGKLAVEALEAQIDLEPACVLDESARASSMSRAFPARRRAPRVIDRHVFSQLPTFASLPAYAGTRSRTLATTVACGSRTISVVLTITCWRGPILALVAPCAMTCASRVFALSSVCKRAERHGEALRAGLHHCHVG